MRTAFFLTTVLLLATGMATAGVIGVSSVTGVPGSVVNVSITADQDVRNAAAIGFLFDARSVTPAGEPPLVIVDNVKLGSIWPSGSSATKPLLATNLGGATSKYPLGTIYIGIVASAPVSGPGEVCTVPVQIPPTARSGDVYTIVLTSVEVSDLNGRSIAAQGGRGTVTVQSPQAGKVTVGKASGQQGATAMVEISVDADVKGFTGFQAALKMDPALVVVPGSAEFGPLVPSSSSNLLVVNANTPGKPVVGAVVAKPLSGPGVVVRLPVVVPATAKPGTVYPVSLVSVQLSDANGQALPTPQMVDGSITVAQSQMAPGLITVKDAKGRVGQPVTVEVVANELVKGITGATLDLDFTSATPAAAPPISVANNGWAAGSMFPQGTLIAANVNTPGKALIGIAGPAAVSGPGQVALITFNIPRNAPKGAVYSVAVNAKVSINGADVPIQAVGGTITVIASRKKGDVNNDDVIGVSDATLALKVALKLLNVDAESFAAADLNGDGMISMGEVTQILRAALGLAQLPQS